MTQIQTYENMSKEALIEHHKLTLQQHADDMDMLSKELASKSLTVPHGYRLVRLSDIETAIQRSSVFDDGGDGADPESARSYIAILRSMLKTDRTAPVAIQEPDQSRQAVVEALSSLVEAAHPAYIQDQHFRNKLIKARDKAFKALEKNRLDQKEKVSNAEPVVMGHGNVAVGGCRRSDDGTPGIIYLKLPKKRERETDCSDIYPVGREAPSGSVLACIYFTTPEVLQQSIDVLIEIQQASAKESLTPDMQCTCPSGDGSLRWPCPVHPPESEQKVQR